MTQHSLARRVRVQHLCPSRCQTKRILQLLREEGQRVFPLGFDVSTKISKELECSHDDQEGIDLFIFDRGIPLEQIIKASGVLRKSEGERRTGIVVIASEKDVKGNADFVAEALEHGVDDVIVEGVEDREVMARITAVLRLKLMTDRLRIANHRLKQLSLTDELTGLSNMRAFYDHFARYMRTCRHGNHSLGVIMFDLDHFKAVNDTTNHLVGSFVIAEVGKLVKFSGLLCSTDLAARYGGDEFIILTKDESSDALLDKAETIRKLIEKAHFIYEQHCIVVTASMGACWSPAGYTGAADHIVKAADLMCYQSKIKGRNQSTLIEVHRDQDLEDFSKDWEKSCAKVEAMRKFG